MKETGERGKNQLDYSRFAHLVTIKILCPNYILFEYSKYRYTTSLIIFVTNWQFTNWSDWLEMFPVICSRQTSLSPLSLLSPSCRRSGERTDRRTIKLNSSVVPREFHDESNRNSRLLLGERKERKKQERERERMSKRPAVPQCGHRGPINPPPPVRFRVKRMEGFIGLSGCPHPRDLESNCR